MVEIGNFGKYYTVNNFLEKVTDEDNFVKKMSRKYSAVGYGELEQGQINAWKDCYHVLCDAFKDLPISWKMKVWMLFEYVLPVHAPWTNRYESEKHIRSDVILLTKDKVIVLEFKRRQELFIGHVRQANKYGKRLRQFHVASQNMDITTILVLTLASNFKELIDNVIVCSPDMISSEIKDVLGEDVQSCNIKEWLDRGFIEEPNV